MEIIKLKKICKKYGSDDNVQTVLKDVDLVIKKGTMTSIMGPSGSGKSSLLNIIGLLDSDFDGEYFLDDFEVSKLAENQLAELRNKKIGFVFQDFNLIKELSALDNVKMSLLLSNIHNKHDKTSKKEIEDRSVAVLKQVGLEKKKKKKPGQLSGGQKQRVAIARALVGNPDMILADEPTGALDSATGVEIMNCLKDLNESGKTIIIVTHDINIANQCENNIVILDGKIMVMD